jgi:hypothetical protein
MNRILGLRSDMRFAGGAKISNAYLPWAFGEAAVLFLCDNPQAK